MGVWCVPLTSFTHDRINAHEGKAFQCRKALADDLERAGLVRVRRPRVTPADVNVPPTAVYPQGDAGKAQDDGAGRPSSVSPAAPASHPMTLNASERGRKRRRKRGA